MRKLLTSVTFDRIEWEYSLSGDAREGDVWETYDEGAANLAI